MPVGAYAVASDTGRRRRRNEDNYVVAPPLFGVADGMGGAQAGEIASHLAATSVQHAERGGSSDEEHVTRLIQDANRSVYERARADASTSGMGTTMTVALLDGDIVRIGHVGDSRAYLVREGRLEQLTEDHSLVNELLKSGKLSPQEAELHPQRSVITRAVGTDPDVDVDAFAVDTSVGDIFLLCSDGLTDMVGDEDILELVERNRRDLDAAAKALVGAANKGGGDDNITVVAFEIAPDGEAAPAAEEPRPEDEDTLTEADRVPTVSLTPEEEPESATGPKPPRKVLAFLVLLILAIAASIVLYVLVR